MSKIVQSTCNYCGVGCSIQYHIDDDGTVNVKGTPEYPVNNGILCPKGFKIHDPIVSDKRGTSPLVKKNGKFEEASWDEALGLFAKKVKEIQSKHGKDSVAFISTGQLYTEEMAMLGQVARTGMGIHGDGNTRQCMASAVVGYKQALGFDAPPFTYKDIEESDCIVLIGSNMPVAHPIVWNRIKKNPHNPEIVVIDPRYSDAAKKSTLHLPITPKRDLLFLYMVIHQLIKNDWIDKEYIEAHTNDFDKLKSVVLQYDPANVEKETGISKQDFDSFVEKIHKSKRLSMWWTMGVNQSHVGVRTVQAIISLCVITGNIGRPGTGANSMTGQTNAMGSRMFSNTTCLYGGRDYGNEEHRKYVGEVLGLDPSVFPEGPTLPYDKIIEGVDKGTIKGLWFICTNPLYSWINTERIRKAIKNLDLLVVQDLFPNTISAQEADIYLPAAGAGEKVGFVINSERRLGATQKIKEPPGNALPDFEIFKLLAVHYGCENVIKGWDTPADVFKLLRACSKGMPCDITGVRDYNHLIEKNGIQWPYPEENPDEAQERRLFEDGKFYTGNGKVNLLAEDYTLPQHEPDKEYPFYLLTGRGTIFQFHTNTRTGKSETLRKQMSEELYVEFNEGDAQDLNVSTGDVVKLSSKAKKDVKAVVKISDTVRKGYIFLPMHYDTTNALIEEEFDPYSRQPSFKMGAVKVEV